MNRAVIRSLRLLPSPPVAAGCFSPTSKYKQNMLFILKIFLLAILSTDICHCDSKVQNATVITRREILEQQARTAYQNACYRLQELSNWMTAVFRIKSVWASATVNEIASRSEGSLTESDRRNRNSLPSRPKTMSSECSLSSVQVTAQTYAYLQSQMVMMKWLLGRNIFKSSKERLGGAKERIKMLDTFNNTLNDVVSKLKLNTANAPIPADSEVWKGRSIINNVQEGRFLQLLQSPKTLLMNFLDEQVLNNGSRDQAEPRSFFQNLGRNIDKLIFPVAPVKSNSNVKRTLVNVEQFETSSDTQAADSIEQPVNETESSIDRTEHSVAINKHSGDEKENPFTSSVAMFQHSRDKTENPFTSSVAMVEHSEDKTDNSFTSSVAKTEHSEDKTDNPFNRKEHSSARVSPNNAIMFSSIL